MNYKRELSACFTGHRIVKSNFDTDELDRVIQELLDKGVRVFYNGMAIGFDSIAFERILSFKTKYDDIKIIACVPCKNQEKNFNSSQTERYKKFLSQADEVIVLSNEYTPSCMMERNRYMVENSSYCVAYIYKAMGGSYSTVVYALKNELQVIYIK